MKFKVTTWNQKEEKEYVIDAMNFIDAMANIDKKVENNIPDEYTIAITKADK